MSCRGFTIIELLVAMLIIGLIASMALPSLPSENSVADLRKQIVHLEKVMELQSEESILTGSQRGLFFQPGDKKLSYEWLQWDVLEQKWQPLGNGAERLAGDIQGLESYEFKLEGELTEIEYIADNKDLVPHVVFYSSGEITDFEMRVFFGESMVEVVLVGGFKGVELKDGEEQLAL